MKLERYALIAEVVSAIAVVVSLVYVGIGIRQNSATLRAATFQTVANSLTDLTGNIGSDRELTRIWLRGNQDGLEKLTPSERDQFTLLMVAMGRRMENAFIQKDAGFLTDEQWEGMLFGLDRTLRSPGGRQWWDQNAELFSDRFRAFVNERNEDGANP